MPANASISDTPKGMKSMEESITTEAKILSVIHLYYTFCPKIQIGKLENLTPEIAQNKKDDENQDPVECKFTIQNERQEGKEEKFHILKRLKKTVRFRFFICSLRRSGFNI